MSRREPKHTVLHSHDAPVYSASFSPNGFLLASTSKDHTTLLWEVATGTRLRMFATTSPVMCAAWSVDSRRLMIGMEGGGVRMYGNLPGAAGNAATLVSERLARVEAAAFAAQAHDDAGTSCAGTVHTRTGTRALKSVHAHAHATRAPVWTHAAHPSLTYVWMLRPPHAHPICTLVSHARLFACVCRVVCVCHVACVCHVTLWHPTLRVCLCARGTAPPPPPPLPVASLVTTVASLREDNALMRAELNAYKGRVGHLEREMRRLVKGLRKRLGEAEDSD